MLKARLARSSQALFWIWASVLYSALKRQGGPGLHGCSGYFMKFTADKISALVGCVFVSTLIFILYANNIHYKYVMVGPYLLDTSWFNFIVGPEGAGLDGPRVLGGSSFFNVHIAPLLIVFKTASEVLLLTDEQPLELMLGVGFAIAAGAAFLVVRTFLQPLGWIGSTLLALLFAVAFALSGVMRAIGAYPHFEILYVGLGSTALWLMFQRRTRPAWVFLALCLTVREDAGLHLACILGAYLMLASIQERGFAERLRDLAPFLGACLAYAAVAILVQKTIFESANTFSAIYSGSPPYAHLTPALLKARFDLLAGPQVYVTLTLAAGLAVLLFKPRPVALTGILAAAPWFVLNVTANSAAAGSLSLYYPFPFLVLVLAPFVVTADLPPATYAYVDHL